MGSLKFKMEIVKPDQIADAYYPNVIFSDPRFILPVIFASLAARIEGKTTTVPQLIEILAGYGGLAAEVSAGAKTLLAMVDDPDCIVFLTLSGAMTIAKMSLIICDMIELGMVQGICTTGALMAHGLVEQVGLNHFKYHPDQDDEFLAQQHVNRLTNTLEPDRNLVHVEHIIKSIFDRDDHPDAIGSHDFHRVVGKHLADHYPSQQGILKSAYQKHVPVFVPAFHDSELGNIMYIINHLRQHQGRKSIIFDLSLDTDFLFKLVLGAQKIGIFTIGGGVPRNYIQNIAALIDYMNESQLIDVPQKLFSYGCRICPDPMYYGHLSGCSYSEGISWHKMDPKGRFSEIHADATQVCPFLVKYVMEMRQESGFSA